MGNKLRQVTLGSYPSMDLAEAREEYRKFKKVRDLNIDPKTSQHGGMVRVNAVVQFFVFVGNIHYVSITICLFLYR